MNVELPLKMVDCVRESITGDADWSDVVSLRRAVCLRFATELNTAKPPPAITAPVAAHPLLIRLLLTNSVLATIEANFENLRNLMCFDRL